MFTKEITVESMIESAARNLVNDCRAWNNEMWEARQELPEKVREAHRSNSAKLKIAVEAKKWMLSEMGISVHIDANAAHYAAKIIVNGVEYDVITDCFTDDIYR